MDNHIIGTPQVECREGDSKPFSGNIYVKGRAKDSNCRQSYTKNATKSYALKLGECGMTRLRTNNPRGVAFSLNVVVSFHPSGFITKNDRAFSIRCFYEEAEEIVTNRMECERRFPTQELSDQPAMPSCTYEVRGSLNGPLMSFASVGEQIYHVWSCGPSAAMGMLVRNCKVTDGDGDEHLVIDENGCTTDPSLLDEIVYDRNLMRGYAVTFKYQDTNTLVFSCAIRLCQKQMGMCEDVTVSPSEVRASGPEIPEKEEKWEKAEEVASVLDDDPATAAGSNITLLSRSRERRALLEAIPMEMDVATPQLFVLDQDERRQLDVGRLCVSRAVVPLMPIGLVLGLSFLLMVGISCYRAYFVPKKQLLFY
ncbi:ZP domain-containing protein [Aphelenchoides fujianensis]|nr:ZP domain-containing protein [Aphelenchoides fujianensis]